MRKKLNKIQMKRLYTVSLIALLMSMVCQSQTVNKWENWQWLLGTWKGEGSGKPGRGEGSFAFSMDLDQNIIIRKNHAEYGTGDNTNKSVHEDLMIIYPSPETKSSKAIYFDNEGHVIEYQVSFSDSSIVFTSNRTGNMPVFRLTYSPLGNNTADVKFEMSQDGKNFTIYLDGKSHKLQ